MSDRILKWRGSDGNLLVGEAFGDASKPPVLLLHGGGQTRHAWGGTGKALAAEGFYAVSLDMRGHGQSDWVADGNYSATRDLLWPRATHVVWLHYGRLTVLWRIVRRTLGRLVRRQTLWSGNRETFARAFLSRESPILWSMQTYDKHQRNYRALRASGVYPQLVWVELRNPRQAPPQPRRPGARPAADRCHS